jgi:exonuclease III
MSKIFNLLAPPFILPLLAVISMYCLQTEEQGRYYVRCVAFYNLENLFDTVNDTLVFDDERTPAGRDHWTQERYKRKITRIAGVLSDIGYQTTARAPDLIGLCEVEKREVLDDLINTPVLVANDYRVVHFDSPDERGIDVALLYRPSAFSPTSFKSRRLLLISPDGERDYTRDQLVVGGIFDGERVYFIVNHWPSRSGGQARSAPYRKAAAELSRHIIDSVLRLEPEAKIILMGDFNDNPTDISLKKHLRSGGSPKNLRDGDLYNPMEALYKKGGGSLAYRDIWSLFDQILLSEGFVGGMENGYRFWKAGIHNPPYLSTGRGRYRGYPLRTYSGGRYTGGFSDHFPVYIFLVRKVF